MSDVYVICGLGNPGDEYRDTRHNVGFMLVDHLAERFGGRWAFPRPEYALCRARIRGADALLVKPQTYMNLSGDALRELLVAERFGLEKLLVCCDDIALPAGEIRLREKGSDGGQKGLRSIVDALGTTAFARLRLGIGAPDDEEASDYVLGAMGESEAPGAKRMVAQAGKCVEVWVAEGIDRAMSRFNRRPPRDSGATAETD